MMKRTWKQARNPQAGDDWSVIKIVDPKKDKRQQKVVWWLAIWRMFR
jgi:hypothetical protein